MEESHVETENAANSKRKLEPTILDNFTKLTKGAEKIRIKSGVNLIKYLSENESDENSEYELKYALTRLIRGLGSSKVNARTGFYTTLVGLLNVNHSITVDLIFEHVNKELHKAGSNTKSENADIFTGHILICSAILRSNLFAKSSSEDQHKVLEFLIKAGKEKTYLKLASYILILDLLEKIDENEFEKIVFPLLKDELSKPWADQTMDNLYLFLGIKNKFKNALKTKFLLRHLGTTEIICDKSLKHLSDILITIPRVTSLKHPVYTLFTKEISESDLLLPFIEEFDKNLHRPNRNKFLVTTQMIKNLLDQTTDKSIIPDLIGKNYIIQLLGSFRSLQGKQKDPELTKSVYSLFEQIVSYFKTEDAKTKPKIEVLKKLLFYPGTFIFEKITRSKIVQFITATLDVDGVKKLGKLYKNVILAEKEKYKNETTKETWLNNDRLYASHLLVKLLNHPSVQKEPEWKVEQLKFLMNLGIFKEEDNQNIGCELAASLKETFFRSLDLKLAKLEDLCNILGHLVHYLDTQLSEDTLELKLRNTITTDDYNTWKKSLTIITKIENKKKKKKLSVVFLTLFLHMSLQLFNDSKLASDSLKELFSCYERIKKDKNTDETLQEIGGESDDPLWIEVVTDLFLNLLSHNSHLLRSIINYVFPHLCNYMTATSIHQILSVIDPKNEDNPLSHRNSHSDSENEDSDDDEEQNNKNEDNSDAESDESELDEENDTDEDIDEEETANDKLKMALQQVLLTNNYETDQESIDLDELSETEGENLDKALADAFKQFKPNLGKRSKKQSKDDQLLTHFRVRVLDLIQIYIEHEPSMILTLEIMLPLLQAHEFSVRDNHQKPLQDRLQSCLKKMSSVKKYSTTEGVTEDILSELLSSLLDKGTKNSIMVQEMGEQIAECCIFVVKCSQIITTSEQTPKKTKKSLQKSLSGIFGNALTIYLNKRECLIPYVLFKNLVNMQWDGNFKLINLLLDSVFDDQIRAFRKNQVLDLLKIFFSNNRNFASNTEKITQKLQDSLNSFYANTKTLLEELCEDPKSRKIKEKFVINLFLLLSTLKNCLLKLETDWGKIAELVREYRTNITLSKDGKVAFNKLCRTLGVSNIVKMKNAPIKLNTFNDDENVEKDNSVTSDNEDVQVNTAKNNKKKQKHSSKTNDKQKLKKEAKELRLGSLSEGFSNGIDFSSVDDVPEENNKSIENSESDVEVNSESDENTLEEPVVKKKRKKHNKKVENATVSESNISQANGIKNKSKNHKKRGSSSNEQTPKKKKKVTP